MNTHTTNPLIPSDDISCQINTRYDKEIMESNEGGKVGDVEF